MWWFNLQAAKPHRAVHSSVYSFPQWGQGENQKKGKTPGLR